MQTLAQELQIVIAASVLIFVITSFVALFVVIHHRRNSRYLREKKELEDSLKRESLMAQLEVRENTIHHISQEIHDNVGQILSLAKLNLNTLEKAQASDSQKKIDLATELISRGIDELRTLAKSLNSDYVLSNTLEENLKSEFETLENIETLSTELKVQGNSLPLDPNKQLIAFRIIQEALGNSIKHSDADKITGTIKYSDESMTITISDNGNGFEMQNISGENDSSDGIGIKNMEFRSKLLNAQLHYTSQKGIGTEVSLEIPLIDRRNI